MLYRNLCNLISNTMNADLHLHLEIKYQTHVWYLSWIPNCISFRTKHLISHDLKAVYIACSSMWFHRMTFQMFTSHGLQNISIAGSSRCLHRMVFKIFTSHCLQDVYIAWSSICLHRIIFQMFTSHDMPDVYIA
jgi:hypothetical protein